MNEDLNFLSSSKLKNGLPSIGIAACGVNNLLFDKYTIANSLWTPSHAI
jgi:hypothetical protein